MKILAVIPARGGSKGVLKKNIRKVANKPLLEWTLDECKKIQALEKYDLDFIVSTDDIDIANVASDNGFVVDSLRPKELSGDSVLTIDVLKYELDRQEKRLNRHYDYLLLLQPTCPLRNMKHIIDCIDLIAANDVDSIISVKNVSYTGDHPFRMKRIENGLLINLIDQGYEDMRPRQELPDVYLRNGCIYLSKATLIRDNLKLVGDRCIPYKMNEEHSINIDTEVDLVSSEFYLNRIINNV
jgi:CMP-N,N'-diacetyllegionaminic acid synthase